MNLAVTEALPPIGEADREELDKLVNAVALSDHALTLFAIAPESAPDHPVVKHFKAQLGGLDESFQFSTFFYSDNSLFEFLANLDRQSPPELGRQVILVFGLEQLPTPRLKREMEQLNLARERIFQRNLILVFCLIRKAFLDEFRNLAPDFWDWRGKVAQFKIHPPINPLLYPYLEWLISENSYLKMSGVMQVNRQVDIFLDQIYVSLQAERRQYIQDDLASNQQEFLSHHKNNRKTEKFISLVENIESTSEIDTLEFEKVESNEFKSKLPQPVVEKVELSAAVCNHRSCVILGAPGSGKTTLLRYLALHFAKAKRDKHVKVKGGKQEDLGESLLPIFFRLADYAEKLEQQPELSLLDYLCQFYRHWENYFDTREIAIKFPNLLLMQIQLENCLILLDGLDEVFDQQSRQQIVDRIETFTKEFSGNKFVVTSRIAGYQEVKLGEQFTVFTVTDMNEQQVDCFLSRWCRAIERAQRPEASDIQWQRAGDDEAKLILESIQSNDGVKRLTTNPLLLTILALIHRNGTRLPQRRVDLYALAVKTLTEDWQLAKKLPNASKVLLKESELIPLLAPLAYWMHKEKPSGLVTHTEVENQLAIKIGEMNNVDPHSEEVKQIVAQFLRRVRETTGLFVESAPGVYGFMHLTFEEYFAARYIADHPSEDILKIIQKHLKNPRWNEPILLALGFINSNSYEQSQKLIARLFRDLTHLSNEIESRQNSRVLSGVVTILKKAEESLIKIHKEKSKKILNIPNALLLKLIIIFSKIIILLWNLSLEAMILRKYSSLLEKSNFAFQVLPEINLSSQIRSSIINGLVSFESFSLSFPNVSGIKRDIDKLQKFTKRIEGLWLLKFLFTRLKRLESYLQDLAETQSFVDRLRKLEKLDLNSDILESLRKIGGNFTTPHLLFGAQRLFLDIVFFNKSNLFKEIDGKELVEQLCQFLPIDVKASMYYQLGRNFSYFKKFDEEITSYEQSRNLYQLLDQPTNVASQWDNLAECYRKRGKYDKALDCQHQCLKIRRTLRNKSSIAFTYYKLGKIYQEWEKYTEAISSYEQSRNFYQLSDRNKDVANQLYWLGSCYLNLSQYKKASDFFRKCLHLRKKSGNATDIAVAYSQLGRIYHVWGKYSEAISYFEQSRDLYQQLEQPKSIANQWSWIAGCYSEWSKYEQALKCQQQCLLICQTLNDQASIALTYHQFGRIYHVWGKYEEAIIHYGQSRDLYQQLEQPKRVANLWTWIAGCYSEWGKYEQALECQQQCLLIRQTLDDQASIALTYNQLGRIYQAWGKYEEAITYHEQSRDLYKILDLQKNVSNQLSSIASCHRDLKDYTKAIQYYQNSLEQNQSLEQNESVSQCLRQISNTQRQQAKYLPSTESIALLELAEQNLQQALEIDTVGDYRRNLANDSISLALLTDERLRNLPEGDTSIPNLIAQFKPAYTDGFTRFAELGQIVGSAEATLDIARAYLEIEALADYDLATTLAHQSLQTFQDFNRPKLQATACKLLGEIYIKLASQQQPEATKTAEKFLSDSLQLYRDLGIAQEIEEVEQLLLTVP